MQSRPHRRFQETGRTRSQGGRKKNHVELAAFEHYAEQSLMSINLTFAAIHYLIKRLQSKGDGNGHYNLVETWHPVNAAQKQEFTASASLRRV
jgi:hypothetical protein